LGKINGFSEEQIIELRKGLASFDGQLEALVKFAASVVSNKGRASEETKQAFFDVGYTESNMIDVIIVIGDKIISNYIHNLTGFEIDFPLAKRI
jgi:alkylhydroperoxidase family enzyme